MPSILLHPRDHGIIEGMDVPMHLERRYERWDQMSIVFQVNPKLILYY
jgi:hypothetical protein